MAATLPVEIWSHIFYSFTSLGTLLSCRLASRTLCHLATPAAFYHVRLPAWNDGSRFTNIARSGHLRSLVREVTVDTCINPDFLRNRPDPEYQPSADFFSALPWLRFLTGLKRLNLRFHDNNDFGEDDEAVVTAYFDFQYFVLWTIFSSLTDHWSASQAHGITTNSEIQLWERTRTPTGVQMIDDEQYWVVLAKKLASAGQPAGPVELEALTISNLAGCTDERLTDSDSFKQALSTVTDLRLHVKFANQDLGDPHDDPVLMREQNAFMASLSRAWLAPEVARKLRVLSLFCSVYWGWNPKLDFRHINPGTDADSGFPKLEVLALGKFVFSHEWQKDWFASLGRRNGHGGLRELYLEDCALLHTVYGYDELDPEYPAPDYKHIQSTDMVTPPRNQPPSTRWHHLFTSWREVRLRMGMIQAISGGLRMVLAFESIMEHAT
ncbi:hypothetical protein F4780DRAFT_776584 [Xylariomycetidae sp. FL0641]|nr:hypothetical protein F4780DRAFT_776584 [Xylariomycetidae sp. FL0641]